MASIQPICTIVASPVGDLTLVAIGDRLAGILWPDDPPGRVRFGTMLRSDAHPVLVETARQLDEYFLGTRRRFDLSLHFVGTPFQRRVWEALLAIPYGETRSYAAIARMIDRPTATRAVGAANGRNPISIVAPCHRVVGSNGRLTGFAGGLTAKRMLLDLEASRRPIDADEGPLDADGWR